MTVGEVIALLVLKCGVPADYALDGMPLYIADLLLEHAYMVDQGAQERMRWMMWATIQPNMKKQIKPTDLMHFSWEEREKEAEISKPKNWEELQQQARLMRAKLKKNG